MFGGIDWDATSLAGAFALGAILATIAVLRVVRALTAMFASELRRNRLPRKDADDDAP